MSRPPAPQEVADLTRGLDPDCADVIALQSKNSADALRSVGWRGDAAQYDIGVYHGDREVAKSLLGRSLTANETRALEACIRYYLRERETS